MPLLGCALWLRLSFAENVRIGRVSWLVFA